MTGPKVKTYRPSCDDISAAWAHHLGRTCRDAGWKLTESPFVPESEHFQHWATGWSRLPAPKQRATR